MSIQSLRNGASVKTRAWPESLVLASLIAAAMMPAMSPAQDVPVSKPDTARAKALDAVVVTGERGGDATARNSAVPITIVSSADLQRTGKAGLKHVLATLDPSLTLAENAYGTSAAVRPFTLRGFSGDEVLVLVNGKRRHTSSFVNNVSNIAGGSAPVDLDLIPVSAIDHIEILHDGAAAQYGSDAIAGVINIILKRDDSGGEADTSFGSNYHNGGATLQQQFNKGFKLGNGGFINLSLDARRQKAAPLPVYPTLYPSNPFYTPQADGSPDPREATIDRRTFDKGYGQPTNDKLLNLGYNLELPLSGDLSVYSNATLSYRDVVSASTPYNAGSVSNLTEIFPDGYQAYRHIYETDYQFTAGLKGLWAGWNWDLSSSYGRDHARLHGQNTLNPSLGPDSPTAFYLGEQDFDQLTTNLDFTRAFEVGLHGPLHVSWGLEQRWEQYQLGAGEPDSYINGGYASSDGPYAGVLRRGGLQAFNGYTPDNATRLQRDVYAGYGEAGADITERWHADLAGRYEHYSDTSHVLSGQLSTRFAITPELAVRGSFGNGFRAPSLQQTGFATTGYNTANLGNGYQSIESLWLRANSPVAAALGATPLKPERSRNLSVGLVYNPTDTLHFSIDAYQVRIDDFIASTGYISGTAVGSILAGYGYSNLDSVKFFTNAADIRSRGIDATASWLQDMGRYGHVSWSFSGNVNHMHLLSTARTPVQLAALGPGYQLVNTEAQKEITQSSPNKKLIFGGDWQIGKLDVLLHQTQYGKYREAYGAWFDARWITDLEASYQFTPSVNVAVGANNLFDVRPFKSDVAFYPSLGESYYGNTAPYGLNGGYWYARLAITF
jgi:iron complex outermembrane receptor protein